MTSPRATLDEWGLALARAVATRSPCCRRQVGAVLIKDKRVVGHGYNGPPKNHPHRTVEAGPHQCVRIGIPSGAEPHRVCCVHAEANVLLFADRGDAKGATMFCTDSPCAGCARILINAGVEEVVCGSVYADFEGLELFRQSRIRVRVASPSA